MSRRLYGWSLRGQQPQEQEFGEARILLAAQGGHPRGASAEEIIPRILDAVERFAEGVPTRTI